MNRDEAYQVLTKYLHNKNLLKHCLACEATMKALCKRLETNPSEEELEKWGISGLCHDADYELAQNTNQLDKHGNLLFEKEPTTFPEDIKHAIQAHNYEGTKVDPENNMDWSIAICDGLTGFIVACALVMPEKKLSAVTPEFVIKKFGQASFAKGVRRNVIELCDEKLGIPFPEFVSITLSAMQGIHEELGL